ncbi:MAG: hypothetical protein E4H36_11405 [Spirochaetales bacterium]|nr:MAG: hypothetical protein E4H36_11405 [Spirochaetales bacterium]
MKEKPELSLENTGTSLTLRHRGLENSHLTLFLIFAGLSIVLPLLFIIFFRGLPDLLYIILFLFGLSQAGGWGTGVLVVREGKSLRIDRTSRTVVLTCFIPVLSILTRDLAFTFRSISGLVLQEQPVRGGRAWFLFLDIREGKPVKVMGPVEDNDTTKDILKKINDLIKEA